MIKSLKHFVLFAFLVSSTFGFSQVYPAFGPEINVTINGLTLDAMEPFISPDGNHIFFNNLNDGVDTKLYYASKVNDSTFTFIGELNGPNQPNPPHLDAVPDLDSLNNFFWTSDRDYPAQLHNLHRGTYSNGSVSSIGRVHGDFNKDIPGWLIMDHGISIDGELLYVNNARFDGVCQGPCETILEIAQKVNDSTFNVIPNSNSILQTINDTNYIYYAPCISANGLELYYTRYQRDTITEFTLFEICVAVRDTPSDNFSIPTVLFSEFIADLIEAPTLTTDQQIMYYHRSVGNTHNLVMRYRNTSVGIESIDGQKSLYTLSPNPTSGKIIIKGPTESGTFSYNVTNTAGEIVKIGLNMWGTTPTIDLTRFEKGMYFVNISDKGQLVKTFKVIKE